MVLRHIELTKKTGASLRFGETLLCAPCNIFLMSVLTSMYDPRAPALTAVEEERKTLRNEEELHDMRDDTKKKEEHIYPIMSLAQFNQAVKPIYSVYICPNSIFRTRYTQFFLRVTVAFQSFPTQKKISNPSRLLVWTSPLTLSSFSYLLSLLPRKHS